MQNSAESQSVGHSIQPASPLFRKRLPVDVPVESTSASLFRFGEQCNNRCPMCSNTGEAALFFHSTEELVRRANFLREKGFRRAVVTGGEATIHPGFWTVIDALAAHGITWDINTHGRTFSQPGFVDRAVSSGLKRAIVSLHSHDPAISAAIFGTAESAHHETIAGIEALLAAGVEVMVNCVLCNLNRGHLEEYLQFCVNRFGNLPTFKFVFPSTIGKGGKWAEISALRYDDVRDTIRDLRESAARRKCKVAFESFPNCVLNDPSAANLGRSGFGESHYLDDARGDEVYSMRHIEAELSVYGEACRSCSARRQCPGISLGYAKRYGVSELTPL